MCVRERKLRACLKVFFPFSQTRGKNNQKSLVHRRKEKEKKGIRKITLNARSHKNRIKKSFLLISSFFCLSIMAFCVWEIFFLSVIVSCFAFLALSLSRKLILFLLHLKAAVLLSYYCQSIKLPFIGCLIS